MWIADCGINRSASTCHATLHRLRAMSIEKRTVRDDAQFPRTHRPSIQTSPAASSAARPIAVHANPRSAALDNAFIEAAKAKGTPTTMAPGPSTARGWPQQNTCVSPAPPKGTKPSAKASFPVMADTPLGPFVRP